MLETERCILNGLRVDDEEDMVRLQTDEEVYRYLGGPKDEASIREGFTAATERGFSPYSWAIRAKDSETFIGIVSLSSHHDGEETELSYLLLPKWWGQGYAQEACQAVLDYAQKELGLQRVIAETQSANERSRRLLVRLGMRYERSLMRFGAEQSIYTTQSG